jgi:hypothetical protein
MGITTAFHLVAHVLTRLALLGEIPFDSLALSQIKRDDGVNVHQS